MSTKDFCRYNLVTKFVCAQCGTQLMLSYAVPKENFGESEIEVDDRITGAAKVENRIAIHPCGKCYREATEPLEYLRKAVAAAQKGQQ